MKIHLNNYPTDNSSQLEQALHYIDLFSSGMHIRIGFNPADFPDKDKETSYTIPKEVITQQENTEQSSTSRIDNATLYVGTGNSDPQRSFVNEATVPFNPMTEQKNTGQFFTPCTNTNNVYTGTGSSAPQKVRLNITIGAAAALIGNKAAREKELKTLLNLPSNNFLQNERHSSRIRLNKETFSAAMAVILNGVSLENALEQFPGAARQTVVLWLTHYADDVRVAFHKYAHATV